MFYTYVASVSSGCCICFAMFFKCFQAFSQVFPTLVSSVSSIFFSMLHLYVSTTPPMLSQHSRSQALVKEEGCDRRGEPMLNLAILMEMKPERKPLGRNPLSNAPGCSEK